LLCKALQAGAAFPNFRGGNSSPPQAAKCVRTNSRILHHVGNYVKITAEPHRSKPQWFNFVHHKKNPEKNTCGDRVESIGSPVRRSFSGGGNYILILLALSMVEVGEENF